MIFASIATLLFPVAIMAVPALKPATGDDQCTPVSYTLSEYSRELNPHYNFLSFNIQSAYTVDSRATDRVQAGVNCEADGAVISGSNQCNIRGEKLDELVFLLRGAQNEAKYRIHHKWQCNNATWESINNIDLPPLNCDVIEDGKNGETDKCTAKPIIFTPQNVQKLEDDKKAAGKAKAVKPSIKPAVQPSAQPSAKSADCRNPPKCKLEH